jgi:CheY-like chemotaxis protein
MTTADPPVTAVAAVRPQTLAAVRGVITSTRALTIGGGPALACTLTDGSGDIDLMFVGRFEIAGLQVGRRCRAAGRAARRGDALVFWNPRYWLEPAGPRAVRVLVVDDDQAIRRVLELALTAHGYQVDLAVTAAAAIESARTRPDLVMLDIGLPDGNGLSAIGTIHEECDAPVIVISARDEVPARAAALAAGASDYLAKPFAMRALLGAIRQLERPAERPRAQTALVTSR